MTKLQDVLQNVLKTPLQSVFGTATIIATAGQSNIERWWSQATDAPANLKGGLEAGYPSLGTVTVVDSADSGSAIIKTNDASKYWVDDDSAPSYAKGTSYTAFTTALNGRTPDAILLVNGEDDADGLAAASSTRSEVKNGLQALIDFFVADYPNVKIFIQPLVKRNNATNSASWKVMREIQWEIYEENAEVFWAAESYDLAMADTVHLADASYETMATRHVPFIGEVLTTGSYSNYIWDYTGLVTFFNAPYRADLSALVGTDFQASAGEEPTLITNDGARDNLGWQSAGDATTLITLSSDFTAGAYTIFMVNNNGNAADAPFIISLDGSSIAAIQVNSAEKHFYYRNEATSAVELTGGGATAPEVLCLEWVSTSVFNFYKDEDFASGYSPTATLDPQDVAVTTENNIHAFSLAGSNARTGHAIQSIYAIPTANLDDIKRQTIANYLAIQGAVTLG